MDEVRIIYISMQTCGVCHAVKPRVKELAKEYKIPVEEIDATLHPEVASRYEVLTVPAVLLMVGDKESSTLYRPFGTRKAHRSSKGVCGKLENLII